MRVTVKEWAARNGVSERAVRARLTRGTLPGTKERDPGTGAELWYVDVPERSGMVADPGSDNVYLVNNAEGLGELVRHIAGLEQTIMELSGRCGFLQARVQDLEREIRLLSAPAESHLPESSELKISANAETPHQSAPSANALDSGAECPPRPPWWKFWTKFMVLFV